MFSYYYTTQNRYGKPIYKKRVILDSYNDIHYLKIDFINIHPFNKSTNEFYINKIVLDFDNTEGYTKDFVKDFKEFINEYQSHAWFTTGCKGFNIILNDFEPFIVSKKDREAYKKFVNNILKPYQNHNLIDYIDLNVSLDINRITRPPFSKRYKCKHDYVAKYRSNTNLKPSAFIDHIYKFNIKENTKKLLTKYACEFNFKNNNKPLITDLINIRKVSGRSCYCPFHKDKNPSAFILDDGNGIYCASCKTTYVIREEADTYNDKCYYIIYDINNDKKIYLDCKKCVECFYTKE